MEKNKIKGAIDQSVVDYAVYEDATEFAGVASVTLPDISFLTQQLNGAGIAGNYEAVLAGMVDVMTLGLQFKLLSHRALTLCEPRRHTITLRVAQQQENTVTASLQIQAAKHIFVAIPKSLSGGSISPASPSDPSGEYAVRYWKCIVDNDVLIEIDPLNFKCIINGVDYLAEVRKALGK